MVVLYSVSNLYTVLNMNIWYTSYLFLSDALYLEMNRTLNFYDTVRPISMEAGQDIVIILLIRFWRKKFDS